VHGPLREQREDRRANVAAAGTPATTAAEPLAPTPPVAAATGETAERRRSRHARPRSAAGRERWEGHATACFWCVELGARVTEAVPATPEWMFVSE
jgi:hypothetical protein